MVGYFLFFLLRIGCLGLLQTHPHVLVSQSIASGGTGVRVLDTESRGAYYTNRVV
jgi:hypothetical protein